jgi:hypothetical protein
MGRFSPSDVFKAVLVQPVEVWTCFASFSEPLITKQTPDLPLVRNSANHVNWFWTSLYFRRRQPAQADRHPPTQVSRKKGSKDGQS